MKKQCVVVGLGFFGMTIAKKLEENGIEVLAIDKNMKLVEKASKFVTKAVCLDFTNFEVVNNLPLADFEIGVVAMGENVAVSVISCMTLKENGIAKVIAKVGDKMHAKVLEKIGVDQIVFPEEYLGELIAEEITKEEE